MREIKFRAFHKPSGKVFKVHGWHSEFVFEDTLNGCGTTETNPCKLEDCKLMQYTGLKDKNGIDIYEGDKVEFYHKGQNVVCEIVYQGSGFKLKWSDGYINTWELNPSKLKIVGNIYDKKNEF
jgi:uncharacterized phage protein (TIGR01671 family)